MRTASKYWNLVRLDSSGKIKITEISQAKNFFQEQFPCTSDDENVTDVSIQSDLMVAKNSYQETGIKAERCLRCFISHQIRQVCIQLDMQFGREHGFSRNDLFIYTLNDTLDDRHSVRHSSATKSRYKPLAVEILETFEPKKANLATWTSRYVKQNRELQRFLLEQGVYFISNWAILNDTNTKQVARILSEFHNLTPTEIEQAQILLAGYHAVYRRDRLKNRQGKGGKCQTPTAEQLTRISALIEQQDLVLSPSQTLSRLELLAEQLREYRIQVRGGRMKQESLDNAAKNTEGMQAAVVSNEADDSEERSSFLQSYQQQFQQSLDSSIEEVITTRLRKFKGKKAAKAPQFTTALELFHCQGESMSAIAPKIDLQAQYQVTRLLKLKELRADIRHSMLRSMRNWTLTQIKLSDFESLKQREQEIEKALGEQIDLVLDEAEKEVSIADSTQSILAQRICAYLDRYH
ncbi:hypothetical protein IQ255_10510 [Pleurocapsales cyanobacterium LEGE 10410]|nr:hypothetical protein [Pleurocapsales cyanobacterium LEGE 10410]